MSANRLPYGAAEILDLRKAGKRPAEMVLVSLIGSLREINPVVIARPETRYDWRFLAGLDVLLVVSLKIEPAAIARVVAAIQSVIPNYFGTWFADRQNGLNLAYGCWRPKTKAGRCMGLDDRRALAGIGRASI